MTGTGERPGAEVPGGNSPVQSYDYSFSPNCNRFPSPLQSRRPDPTTPFLFLYTVVDEPADRTADARTDNRSRDRTNIHSSTRMADPNRSRACAACGDTVEGSGEECARCGRRLSPQCPRCGAVSYHTMANFCTECGARMVTEAWKRRFDRDRTTDRDDI